MEMIEKDRNSWEFQEQQDTEDEGQEGGFLSSSSVLSEPMGMKELEIEGEDVDRDYVDSEADQVYRHRKNNPDDHNNDIIDDVGMDSGSILEKNRTFKISPGRKLTRQEKSYETAKVAGYYDRLAKDTPPLDLDDDGGGDEISSEFVITFDDLEGSSFQTTSSWVSSIINSVASIFGAGYVGIPYALSLAGLPLGILLLIAMGIVSGKIIHDVWGGCPFCVDGMYDLDLDYLGPLVAIMMRVWLR
jgi:hypothetical protein